MNKVILTLDQNEIDPSVSAENRENYFVRRAVRAVLRDEGGRIALLYAGQRKYYKLPGGGVDEGEEIFGSNLILKTKQAQPTAAHYSFSPPENIWLALRAAIKNAALSGDKFIFSPEMVRVRRL